MLLEIFSFNLLHIAHSVQRVEYSLLRGATKYEVCDHSSFINVSNSLHDYFFVSKLKKKLMYGNEFTSKTTKFQ